MPRIPPWRWRIWGPWSSDALFRQQEPPTDDTIRARAERLAERRPWCSAEQNWSDAHLELQSPLLLRWRPSLLRWLGASEKSGWDWIDLSLKLAVPLTIAFGGWILGTISSSEQNKIASNNQKDGVIREYIKEIKIILLDKELAKEARRPGSEAHSVARALTLTALAQLKGEDPLRRSLVFQFLAESKFPVLAGNDENPGANLVNFDLRGTNLSDTDLTMARLDGADLTNATLVRANLSGATLIGATLINSDLMGANLTKARFDKTILKGARMTPVTCIDGQVYDEGCPLIERGPTAPTAF